MYEQEQYRVCTCTCTHYYSAQSTGAPRWAAQSGLDSTYRYLYAEKTTERAHDGGVSHAGTRAGGRDPVDAACVCAEVAEFSAGPESL